MSDTTTVRLENDTADELYVIKGRNRSYNDAVEELIDTYREAEELRERVDELEEQLAEADDGDE